MALDGSRTVSYIRKASPGIIPRPRSDYQVLARRHILANDLFYVVVGRRDMAFEKARGIEIGFGKLYGVNRLVILSPMPSNIDIVEESKE